MLLLHLCTIKRSDDSLQSRRHMEQAMTTEEERWHHLYFLLHLLLHDILTVYIQCWRLRRRHLRQGLPIVNLPCLAILCRWMP